MSSMTETRPGSEAAAGHGVVRGRSDVRRRTALTRTAGLGAGAGEHTRVLTRAAVAAPMPEGTASAGPLTRAAQTDAGQRDALPAEAADTPRVAVADAQVRREAAEQNPAAGVHDRAVDVRASTGDHDAGAGPAGRDPADTAGHVDGGHRIDAGGDGGTTNPKEGGTGSDDDGRGKYTKKIDRLYEVLQDESEDVVDALLTANDHYNRIFGLSPEELEHVEEPRELWHYALTTPREEFGDKSAIEVLEENVGKSIAEQAILTAKENRKGPNTGPTDADPQTYVRETLREVKATLGDKKLLLTPAEITEYYNEYFGVDEEMVRASITELGFQVEEEAQGADVEEFPGREPTPFIWPTLPANQGRGMSKPLAREIEDLINNGDLAPGSVLPTETEFMLHYGFSRNTARDTRLRLIQMGLVESRYDKRLRIRQPDERITTDLANPLGQSSEELEASGKDRKLITNLEMINPTEADRHMFDLDPEAKVLSLRRVEEHKGSQVLSATTFYTYKTDNIADADAIFTPSDPTKNHTVITARMPTFAEMELDRFNLAGGVPIIEATSFFFDPSGRVEMAAVTVSPANKNNLMHEGTKPQIDSAAVDYVVTDKTRGFQADAQSNGAGSEPVFPHVDQGTKMNARIAKEYYAAIASGAIGPGEQLPTEHDMKEYYGVSRNTVREAIKMLATMGLVDMRAGVGAFVRVPMEKATTSLSDPLGRNRAGELSAAEETTIPHRTSGVVANVPTEAQAGVFGIDPAEYDILEQIVENRTGTMLMSTTTLQKPHNLNGSWSSRESFAPSNPENTRSVVTARMPTSTEEQQFGLAEGVPVFEVNTFFLNDQGGVEITATQVLPADRNVITT